MNKRHVFVSCGSAKAVPKKVNNMTQSQSYNTKNEIYNLRKTAINTILIAAVTLYIVINDSPSTKRIEVKAGILKTRRT